MLKSLAKKYYAKRGENIEPWHYIDLPESTIDRVISLSKLDSKDISNYKVLDFGCGSGRYLSGFKRLFKKENLYGVDVDTKAIQKPRQEGFQVQLLNPDKAELPYPNGHFDFVFSSNVIEHIPHDLYLIYVKEIARVLKKGGTLFVCAPNYPFKRMYDMKVALFAKGDERAYYFFDDPTHINCQNAITVEKHFEKYFEKTDFFATQLFFDRYLRFLRKPFFQRKLKFISYKFIGICQK